jgi:RNA polymerase I-specific transcription initiation factor RRN7
MRSKLPPHFHSALEIRAPLKEAALHSTVIGLLELFLIQFEMAFPPLNISLLLFKHVRDLGLPGMRSLTPGKSCSNTSVVEIIPAVRRLADLLDISFSFPVHNAKSYSVASYPEIQLISLIVIAIKLSQPFDDIRRLPTSESDLTSVRIDWKQWAQIMRERQIPGLRRGEELKVKDTEVWNMNAKKIDDYLNWYQSTWIDDREPKSISALVPHTKTS